MKKLLFGFLIVACFSSAANAQACNVEEVAPPAKFKEFSGSVYDYYDLVIAKAYQTSECKILVVASYSSGYGDLLLIRYSNGEVDKTYDPKGFKVVPAGIQSNEAPITIDSIKYGRRLYIYGLTTNPGANKKWGYGVNGYTFAISNDGNFDITGIPTQTGVATKDFYLHIMIDGFQVSPATIANNQIAFDFQFQPIDMSVPEHKTATFGLAP